MALDLFNKRGKEDREQFGERLPPGQKLTDGWPVLHYGGIPPIDLATWKFSVVGLVEEEVHFTWDEFMALPQTTLRSDIHCVTHWSKFDNDWTGVKFTDILAKLKVKPEAKHVMLHSYGGYTFSLARMSVNFTPVQSLSNLLQCVTQWMSERSVVCGSAMNSSQVKLTSSSTSPTIENFHVARSMLGMPP